jgi:hypothetical protein
MSIDYQRVDYEWPRDVRDTPCAFSAGETAFGLASPKVGGERSGDEVRRRSFSQTWEVGLASIETEYARETPSLVFPEDT